MPQAARSCFDFDAIHQFVATLVGEDMHAKRVFSLAGATAGVMEASSLAVHAIGQGLAQVRGVSPKHAIKQVDRLLSNFQLKVWDFFSLWVPQVIGASREVLVAMDWTDFDADGHATVALYRLTGHGRATPLLWKSVSKATLKGHRNRYEDELLERLHQCLPAGVQVTVVMDRGFFDVALLEAMERDWGFGYVVRMRGNIKVSAGNGECRTAAQWVGKGGRAKTLRKAKVTAQQLEVPTVVCVQEKGMKGAWCLAASDPKASARTLTGYYGKRWGIETAFRDLKDPNYGLGLGAIHTRSTQRRDRLILLAALAVMLLTLLGAAGEALLGAAGEALGYDRWLKANTVKRRTHSLLRQGRMHYDLIPTMKEEHLKPLMEKFSELLLQQRSFTELFGLV